MSKAFYNVRLVDEAIEGPGAMLVVGGKIRAVLMGLFTNKATVQAAFDGVLLEDGYGARLGGAEGKAEAEYIDGHGMTLSPAFIDLHTHLRYPGQTHKEDLETGLKAAAAGGYCTVVAMPNTTPVLSEAEKAKEVEAVAQKVSPVKVMQSVSITRDFSGQDTTHLDGLKAQDVPLITQDGQDVENAAVLLDAMCKAANKGLLVSCHSEDRALARAAAPLRKEAINIMAQNGLGPCGTEGFSDAFMEGDGDEEGETTWHSRWGDEGRAQSLAGDDDDDEDDDGEGFSAQERINALLAASDTMLSLAETIAVLRNIALSEVAMCHLHIAHVSTAQAMDAVREAKSNILDAKNDAASLAAEEAFDAGMAAMQRDDDDEGIPSDERMKDWQVTCEVTPHHLALCGTVEPFNRAIVNPPLGTEDDRLALLEGIRDGTVDAIATDHAPHTAQDKAAGAAGFVGLETAYAVCNTVLCAPSRTLRGKLHGGQDASPSGAQSKDGAVRAQISERRLSQLMSANPARMLHLNKGRLLAGYDADLVLLDSEEVWTIDSKAFYSKGRATPFDGMEVQGKVKGLYIGGKVVYDA